MIKIGLFDEKKSFLENDNLGYVFQKNNFKIKFIDGKLTISKFKQNESEHNILKKMLMSIKRNWFNLKISNDEEFNTENKNIDIIFNNYNEKSCNKVEARDDSTLIYYNIYDNIDLECSISNDTLLCTFILRNNCNPKDINITFNENSSIILDENNIVRINLNEFYIIFNNPVYKNFTLNENDDINLNYILNSNNVYINEYKNLRTENRINNNTRSIQNLNIYDPSNYTDVNYIGQRKLTIPISKSKFSYPQSYTTDLMYSISVPIIEDLLLDRTNEIVKSDISLCGVNYPSVKAFISRNIDHITPIVSFSVVLYKNPYSNVFDLNDLNPFDGIFRYAEDYFVGNEFILCDTNNNNKEYYPVDYSFVPIEPKNINYIYENDNYYFYEVILDIYIYPREPLVVSSELENILNEALGNSYGTPITRGELSKIKVLDLKGIDSSNINPVIFQSMPNLVELNLSSCNINEDFLSYLSTLTKLESLDLSNNNLILDLNKLPKTLIDSLHCLDISFEKSEVKPCENAYTSLDRDILINRITDIYPLSYFINLQVLKLKGQGICDISSLITLTNLVYLDISDQEINRGSILPSEELCSSSCDFSLETVFLKDINGELPTILCISDRGYCYSLENGVCYPTGQYCDSCDSCDFIQDCKCNLIIWENIYSNTDVYFTFKDELIDENKIFIFSGVINLNLNIE